MDKIQSSRNFTNKLWNVARFLTLCLDDADTPLDPSVIPDPTTDIDAWIMDQLNHTIEQVTDDLNDYRFSAAAHTLLDFTWHQCCDWYVESIKPHKQASRPVLLHVVLTTLILIHPMMPFVTEVIWTTLLQHPRIIEDHLMTTIQYAHWPRPSAPVNTDRLRQFDQVFDVIREIRHLIKQARASTKHDLTVHISHESPTIQDWLTHQQTLIQSLTHVTHVIIHDTPPSLTQPTSQSVTATIDIRLVLPEVDAAAERDRLTRQLAPLERHHATLTKKLQTDSFLTKAPAHVVEKVREEWHRVASDIQIIQDQLASLS